MPSATVEDYIKQIYLEEQRKEADYVSMGIIAQSLSVAPGTATAMVKSLAASELVDYQPRKGVSLTLEGRTLALRMIRRHRLTEVFLVNTLGLNWGEVHDEAERLEHALSDRVLEALDAFLKHPETDPHGAPIPREDGTYLPHPVQDLTQCPLNKPMRIARVSTEQPEFLDFLETHNLMPGNKITLRTRSEVSESLTMDTPTHKAISIGLAVGKQILVEQR